MARHENGTLVPSSEFVELLLSRRALVRAGSMAGRILRLQDTKTGQMFMIESGMLLNSQGVAESERRSMDSRWRETRQTPAK
jgi:hypothetical protein